MGKYRVSFLAEPQDIYTHTHIYKYTHTHTYIYIYIYPPMYVFILVWSVLYPHVGWLDPPFLTAPPIFDRPGKSGRLSNACLYL